MKLKNIYIGSWVPRTTLHLGEFYRFLDSGETHLSLDAKKLKALKDGLKVKNLSLSGSGNLITAELSGIDFKYFSDGLIVLSKKIEKLEADSKELGDFSVNKLFTSFSYLYSLGAPIPKMFTALFSVLPFIVTVSGATQKEIEKMFFSDGKKIDKVIKGDKCQIFLSSEFIVINGSGEDLQLIENLIFLEDCRSQFNKILNLHRFIWEEVDKIKNKSKLPYKKLGEVRDSLMELDNEVIFLSSRLSQINFLLDVRKSEIDKISDGQVRGYLGDVFFGLDQTSHYLENIWKMTEDNVRSTQNLISSLYQESAQKQLNVLQVIFIISATASIIALGSIYGFEFKAYDLSGSLVYYGDTKSFTFFDLARFGISAFSIGIILYFIFFFVYNRVSYSKISSKEKLQSRELEGIKKMFR